MILSEIEKQFPQVHKAIDYMSEKLDLHFANTQTMDISRIAIKNLNAIIKQLGAKTLGDVLGDRCFPNDATKLAWQEFIVASGSASTQTLLIKELGLHGQLASICLDKIYCTTQGES